MSPPLPATAWGQSALGLASSCCSGSPWRWSRSTAPLPNHVSSGERLEQAHLSRCEVSQGHPGPQLLLLAELDLQGHYQGRPRPGLSLEPDMSSKRHFVAYHDLKQDELNTGGGTCIKKQNSN